MIYNLQNKKVEAKGLVTNGASDDYKKPLFSNVPNSNCTSLGNYSIGAKYFGRFGLAYKLYGLDESNSKAFERFVVLHAHECVPDNEVSYYICESQGCPTVSTKFLDTLANYIDNSRKPILLKII